MTIFRCKFGLFRIALVAFLAFNVSACSQADERGDIEKLRNEIEVLRLQLEEPDVEDVEDETGGGDSDSAPATVIPSQGIEFPVIEFPSFAQEQDENEIRDLKRTVDRIAAEQIMDHSRHIFTNENRHRMEPIQ